MVISGFLVHEEMKNKTVIYLHGFRSSTTSRKATFLKDFCVKNDIEFLCPPLDLSPVMATKQSITTVRNLAKHQNTQVIIVGSSLGGFYATWIMQTAIESKNLLSIVINPAVRPFRDLESEVNPGKEWQLEALNINPFTKNHHLELKELEIAIGTKIRFPDNILLVATKGDELLSWKEMSSFFKGCQQYIIEGSDHSVTDFSKHWPNIKSFIGV